MTFLDPDHMRAAELEQARKTRQKADEAALRHAAHWTPPEQRTGRLRRLWHRLAGT